MSCLYACDLPTERSRQYACDPDYGRADKPTTQTQPGRALLPEIQPRRWHRTASVGIYGWRLCGQQSLYISVVLCTKKELPVSEYQDRSYVVTRRRRVVVVSLISHPYGD